MADTVSLPALSKMNWLKLPPQAFADLLMVVQFSHSFREFLDLDSAPSLSAVYCSLHSSGGSEVLSELLVHFLRTALFDPGSNALTTSGEPHPHTRTPSSQDTLPSGHPQSGHSHQDSL